MAGPAGMIVIAWLLFAHLVTGSSMLHTLGAHHAPARATSQATVPAPTGPAAVACPDGGACSVADRAAWPPVVPPGLVFATVLVVLAVLTRSVRPSHMHARGPSPPLHLSAQVVLVI